MIKHLYNSIGRGAPVGAVFGRLTSQAHGYEGESVLYDGDLVVLVVQSVREAWQELLQNGSK